MKNKKIKLSQIKVESFVTTISSKEKETYNGAGNAGSIMICLMSIDIECEITPIKINPDDFEDWWFTATTILPNSRNECPPVKKNPNPPIQCSVYHRGSCGGTIGN